MGEYTVAIALLFFLWLIILLLQPASRKKAMLFTGFLYAAVLIPTFWLHKFILGLAPVSQLYNPGYWQNVSTIFNLNNRTGGLAIEDVSFMIFWGGLAAVISERLRQKTLVASDPPATYLPIIIFGIAYLALLPTRVNPIYLLIIPSFLGGLSTNFVRKDLIVNSWLSGLGFAIVYFICFSVFTLLFPYFIRDHYNLKALSGIFVTSIPLEELLFAFTFGFMWGPIYKVVRGIANGPERNVKE